MCARAQVRVVLAICCAVLRRTYSRPPLCTHQQAPPSVVVAHRAPISMSHGSRTTHGNDWRAGILEWMPYSPVHARRSPTNQACMGTRFPESRRMLRANVGVKTATIPTRPIGRKRLLPSKARQSTPMAAHGRWPVARGQVHKVLSAHAQWPRMARGM